MKKSIKNSLPYIINTSAIKIETALHYCRLSTLDPTWTAKNLVCSNSKLFYILEGEIAIIINNTTMIAKKGDLVLIPAGVMHDYHLTKLNYAKKFWLHFDLLFNGLNFFNRYKLDNIIHIGESQEIYGIFAKLVNTSSNSAIAQTNIIKQVNNSELICKLINFYYINSKHVSVATSFDPVWSVVEYIQQHYYEQLTLKELADMAFLSTNHFLRRFRHLINCSPIQYIKLLRLDYAKLMLENTNEPINTIMEKVGILNSAHFSHLFKTYYGCSPKEYRNQHKSQQE